MNNTFMVLLLTATACLAQSTSTATLSGVIQDQTGAVIRGATVTVTNPDTGFTRKVTTDETGFYRLDFLPPANYDVVAEASGFQKNTQYQHVPLQVGAAATIDIQLGVAAASTQFSIVDEAPPIETERSHQANVIEQRAITDLPIDRRDYLTFSLLAPGVADSKALADSNTYRVKQTPDSGMSFYGSNGRGNSVNVDGGESNDPSGGVRPTVGQESVREFQINRSNFSAEYGGARGGVINIVTKSGTNGVHGSAFGFFRNQVFDGTNPFSLVLNADGTVTRVHPDSSRQQFGANIGGPVKKDRTFYFVSYEQLRRRETNAVPIVTDTSIFGPTPTQKAILAQLPAAAAAQLTAALSTPPAIRQMFQINSGLFPFQSDQQQGLLRLDHAWNDRNQLTFRANTSALYETNPNVTALTGISRGYQQDSFDSLGALAWIHTFTPSRINEARVQFDYLDELTATNDQYGPALEIAGYGNFNRDRFLPSETTAHRTEFLDNFSFAAGHHRLKAGISYLQRGTRGDSKTFFSGRFTFGSLPGGLINPVLASTTITALQAFNLGLAQSYQQGFGNPLVKANNPLVGWYLQDEYRVSPKLTLNAGVRYEIDNRHAPLPTSYKNIAPRFGFAWSPNTKTVVRGGYGLYYATIDFQIDYSVDALGIHPDGSRPIAQVLTTIQTAGAQSAANIYGTLVAEGVIGIPTPKRSITPADLTQFGIAISQTGPLPPLSVIFSASPDYRNPLTQQANLSLQHEFSPGFTGTVSGIWVRGEHLTNAYDNNLLPNAPFDPSIGTQNYGPDATHPYGYFVNPLIYQSNVYTSSSNSFYGGMILEASKRLSRGVQFNGNYTWSHATDETTDYNSDFEPNNQFCRRCDRASSSFDERHKVVMWAVLQTPASSAEWLRNWALSPIFQYHSGQPFNLLVGGADLNNDRHNTTDRPAYAGRNTGLGPSYASFDARLQRSFTIDDKKRIDLMIEGFNLMNRLNYQAVNNTVGPTFAGPFNVTGLNSAKPTDPLGFTAAFDPRRLQLGVRFVY